MSNWREIQDLQRKKAEMEFQLHSLTEKETMLEEKARMLEERLAMQDLEERLKVKHDCVENLENRVTDLEKRLKEQETNLENLVIKKDGEQRQTAEYYPE